MAPDTRRRSRLAVVLVLALVILVAVIAWRVWIGYHRFDSTRWKAERAAACTSDVRKRMVGDLLKHHVRIGTPASEVFALLGRPNERGAARPRVRGQWWTYITHEGFTRCGTLILRIRNGRVAEIQRDDA